MTPPHSPLPWTVRQEGAIFDADGVPVISDDGALYPEDRDLIVTAVNNYEKMRKALEEIAGFPAHETEPEQNVSWKWITNAKTIDIACEALGLCRECRNPLTAEGRGCKICGAAIARAALAGEK